MKLLNAFKVKQKLFKEIFGFEIDILFLQKFYRCFAFISLITVNGKYFNIRYISSNIPELLLFESISLQLENFFFYCCDYIV